MLRKTCHFPFQLILACTLAACGQEAAWNGSLEEYLRSQPQRFGTVMADPEKHRVQIIYTQIDRDSDNRPVFRSYTFHLNADEYFYPASTVKLPTALLALEKINDLSVSGLARNTTMLTGVARESQSPAISDHTAPNGLPSVAHYIRKILLVSDNDAFNRLYEFIGQQPLNHSLHEKGYTGSRVLHRLENPLSVEENRHTNPIVFVAGDNVVYEQPAQYSEQNFLADAAIMLGQAEIIDGKLLQRPKDFAEKNAYPLQEQHDIIRALVFPDSVPDESRFRLREDDYRFVYRYMSMYPRQSGIDEYGDADSYPDGFVKFLMFGGDAERIPDNIRIFNKVGDAYGFLTDAAYIVDTDAGIEFILAATVYVNANETFNDNEYEYDSIGLPFLRELGQAIYELELARARPHKPDFKNIISH